MVSRITVTIVIAKFEMLW